jgi:hypothetical protein
MTQGQGWFSYTGDDKSHLTNDQRRIVEVESQRVVYEVVRCNESRVNLFSDC